MQTDWLTDWKNYFYTYSFLKLRFALGDSPLGLGKVYTLQLHVYGQPQESAWSTFCLLPLPVKSSLYFLSDECNSMQYALALKHQQSNECPT